MLVVKVCLRFTTRLLEFVLGYLLIENLLKELIKVLFRQLIVQLTSMRLNDVAAAW